MSSLIEELYQSAKRRLERDIDYHTRVQLLGFKERCSHYVVASYSMPLPNGWPLGQLVACNVFKHPKALSKDDTIYVTVGGSGGSSGVVTPQGGAGGNGVMNTGLTAYIGGLY